MASLVGYSSRWRGILDLATRYAHLPRPLLLVGATGVGKGMLARWIHEQSERRGLFVAVKGGQLVETLYHAHLFGSRRGGFTGADRDKQGAFELASDGTLFLDELPDWSPGAQAAILGPVDEGSLLPVGAEREVPITCRFVFGSHRSLDDLVAAGVLREDLRYRVGDFVIRIPPLRERRVDILVLAYHFLDAERTTSAEVPLLFEPEAIDRLLAFDWPGNARQLRNAMAVACAHARGCERIGVEHFPDYLRDDCPTKLHLEPAARADLVRFALDKAHGNRRLAAEIIGRHPNTIDYHRKRTKLGGVQRVTRPTASGPSQPPLEQGIP